MKINRYGKIIIEMVDEKPHITITEFDVEGISLTDFQVFILNWGIEALRKVLNEEPATYGVCGRCPTSEIPE